ncbi:hypothetical protein MPHL43072_01460 [Mycolicibacterium phlei DSM 43072]|jgi:hypothetical protein|uniref:Uncharacterized protein n=1 Tax=Mycolicibacterium phlei DSM 43239 = CCUG 21000 TaxID=1226750 RepID=A0A5N5V1W1_MYCPH|nr:hypothetical protein MPHL21000_15800 [Mycolicibacterium phlei DSM 43239 = CCUG 21000]KXW60066.1 hypothetical protein MPHL43070_25740 [Mycolicibacterium phlei DSM 43070]KXW65254.1 hypothetical protein MPHL43239_11620 [Mycolicibacterium phlei DSM 43239 = CCUG 21000]KXW72474.1 hypothetical protein MPHL43072_01460 [Mycolicibacterium phlei DSM 43072]
MRLVALLALAVVAAVGVAVWRSHHGLEVWHAAPDASS